MQRQITVQLVLDGKSFIVTLEKGKQQYHHQGKRDEQSFIFFGRNPFKNPPMFWATMHLIDETIGRSIDVRLIQTDSEESFMEEMSNLGFELQMPIIPEREKVRMDRKKMQQ